jgi:hypothetical protein
MNGQMTVIIVCYLISIAFGIYLFRTKKEEKFVPINDYETLISILDETIQKEIKYKHELHYKLKDIKVIYDFEEDLRDIATSILSALSPTVLKELEYYHPRDYIIKYVARYVEVFLIEYTRKNKIMTK